MGFGGIGYEVGRVLGRVGKEEKFYSWLIVLGLRICFEDVLFGLRVIRICK